MVAQSDTTGITPKITPTPYGVSLSEPASRRLWTAVSHHSSPRVRSTPTRPPNTPPLRTSSRRLWTAVSHHSSPCVRSTPTSPPNKPPSVQASRRLWTAVAPGNPQQNTPSPERTPHNPGNAPPKPSTTTLHPQDPRFFLPSPHRNKPSSQQAPPNKQPQLGVLLTPLALGIFKARSVQGGPEQLKPSPALAWAD